MSCKPKLGTNFTFTRPSQPTGCGGLLLPQASRRHQVRLGWLRPRYSEQARVRQRLRLLHQVHPRSRILLFVRRTTVIMRGASISPQPADFSHRATNHPAHPNPRSCRRAVGQLGRVEHMQRDLRRRKRDSRPCLHSSGLWGP